MTKYYFVVAAQTPGVTKSSPPYDRLDDALRGAGLKLGNGARAAWIIDRDGNLVLPPEQVRVRLEMDAPPSAALWIDAVRRSAASL